MKRKNKNGFTLIELLVVITIITLLISILLPALAMARRSAQAIQCLSNQRQIMLGFNVFSNDHHGKFPPTLYYPWGPNHLWAARLVKQNILDKQVFLCPADGVKRTPAPAQSFYPFGMAGRTYAYNGYVGLLHNDLSNPNTGVGGNYLTLATSPSKLIILIERGPVTGGQHAHYIIGCNYGASAYHDPNRGDYHGNKTSNIAFADGHAAAISYDTGSYSDPSGSKLHNLFTLMWRGHG